MAYELLNYAQVTPARLYALVRLVDRLKQPQREDVLDLLQPAVLLSSKEDESDGAGKQSAGTNVYLAARHCNIIRDAEDGTVQLQDDVAQYLGSLETFRILMQKRIWNVTDPDQNNYLFNLYAAWYAVQNERVFSFEEKDFETRFNEELFENAYQRTFNMTKFSGWRQWAVFLGLGWSIKPGINVRSREFLAPDASLRLREAIPQIFKQANSKELEFSQFMQSLAIACAELDGGKLFQRCQDASREKEASGGYLSLALSTGLRQLHYAGFLKLVRQADSTNNWSLYPAEGHPLALKQVTHIQFTGQNNGK